MASALVAAASQHAIKVGVRHLYAHCDGTNQGVLSMYSKWCGFEIEQEEDEEFVRAMKRPQRVLFHKSVLDGDLLVSDPSHFDCSILVGKNSITFALFKRDAQGV